MGSRLGLVTLLVRDYDEAIGFFVDKLGFQLVEDTPLPDGKHWVVVSPAMASPMSLLLARAANAEQVAAIGRQAGGRVFLFLEVDDFEASHRSMAERGVRFLEAPRHEPYGVVAVFEDLCGNRWDLIQKS